MMMMMINEQCK